MTVISHRLRCDRCLRTVEVHAHEPYANTMTTVKLEEHVQGQPNVHDPGLAYEQWCAICVASFKSWHAAGRNVVDHDEVVHRLAGD